MRHLSFNGQFGDLQTSRSQGVELTSHSGGRSFLASGIFVLRMAENLVRLGKVIQAERGAREHRVGTFGKTQVNVWVEHQVFVPVASVIKLEVKMDQFVIVYSTG